MALPKFQVYTADKTSPRSFSWLWFLRLPAIVFSIIVLGLTAATHTTFSNSGCSSPNKLSFNLAVAVISFVILIYLLLASGPSPKVRLLPWVIWVQLALDAFLFILWLAAGSTSKYNCNDLCGACAGYSDLFYDNLLCYCLDNDFYKRDYSPAPKGALVPRRRVYGGSNSDSNSGYAGNADARKAFDALATLIFFLCTAADLFWIFQASRSNHTTTQTTAPAAAVTPAKQEEAGMAAPNSSIPLHNQQPQGANADYYGAQQPMQQQQHGGYPQQQQQPMPQNPYPYPDSQQNPPQYTQPQQYPQPNNINQGMMAQEPYSQKQAMAGQQQDIPQGGVEGRAEMHSPGPVEGGHVTKQ